MGHGDRRSEWAEVGHGVGHDMSRGDRKSEIGVG